MQIIGTRADSTWRVPADWYMQKQRFAPCIDPTTGGPVAVVHDHSDVHFEGYLVDTDQTSPTYRQVIQARTQAHHDHLARTVGQAFGRLARAGGHVARVAGAAAVEAGADAIAGAIEGVEDDTDSR